MDKFEMGHVVEPNLRSRLEGFGYQDVVVREGENHDGDPALFIEVSFDSGDRLLGGERTIAITSEIMAALKNRGEARFPPMRWNYLNGDLPDEDVQDNRFADTRSSRSKICFDS